MLPLPWISTSRVVCRALVVRVLIALSLGGLLAGCGRQDEAVSRRASPAQAVPSAGGLFLQGETVGAPVKDRPWVAHVTTVDLDRDGRPEILACEAGQGLLVRLVRSGPDAGWTEHVVAAKLPAPVHVEAADIDCDGDLDLLISCMGQVFPSNERIGSLVLLVNDGHLNFTPRFLLERVARVVDARVADFDGDGRMDIVVGQFGYLQGEIRVLWQRAAGVFSSEIMLDLPGTVNVPVADYDNDGQPDFAALVSQHYEEIVLFANAGAGKFTRRTIFGSTNEDFGSSGLVASDLNRDGRVDLLYTNGDGFDYAEPGGRPWHGVQWLENTAAGAFVLHRIGDLSGAYGPVACDIDGDDDLDVVAVSGFNDWRDPQALSLAVFINDGRMGFTLQPGAHAPTHLLTAAVADLDGAGRPVLVTGGFHAYAPWDRMSRLMLWRTRTP
ncbi:MAG: VCBS repeat-containing protein [Opitutaceae bacterium]|nr:VCBS repeat-containing protein [Opitutaceae bacterium]